MRTEASGALAVGVILPISVAVVVAWLPRIERRSLRVRPEPGLGSSSACPTEDGNVAVTATAEATTVIERAGGLVFLTTSRCRIPRLRVSAVVASCEPPSDVLAFRRCHVGSFLLFIDPTIPEPRHVLLDVAREPRGDEIVAYLDGFAYVVWR
ncbi:MAG: hypothetical protein ACM3OO_06135 [Planctomycetaceae bacterium]